MGDRLIGAAWRAIRMSGVAQIVAPVHYVFECAANVLQRHGRVSANIGDFPCNKYQLFGE